MDKELIEFIKNKDLSIKQIIGNTGMTKRQIEHYRFLYKKFKEWGIENLINKKIIES